MCSFQALPAPSFRGWQHATCRGRVNPYQIHAKQCIGVATAAVVQPAQLAAIAAEPVTEVAVLAAVGALCAKKGLLPLQGR